MAGRGLQSRDPGPRSAEVKTRRALASPRKPRRQASPRAKGAAESPCPSGRCGRGAWGHGASPRGWAPGPGVAVGSLSALVRPERAPAFSWGSGAGSADEKVGGCRLQGGRKAPRRLLTCREAAGPAKAAGKSVLWRVEPGASGPSSAPRGAPFGFQESCCAEILCSS